MNRDEARAILFGIFSALLTALFVHHRAYPAAVFEGLFTLYWFMLAVKRERTK